MLAHLFMHIHMYIYIKDILNFNVHTIIDRHSTIIMVLFIWGGLVKIVCRSQNFYTYTYLHKK